MLWADRPCSAAAVEVALAVASIQKLEYEPLADTVTVELLEDDASYSLMTYWKSYDGSVITTSFRQADWKVLVDSEYPRPSTGVVERSCTRLSRIRTGPAKAGTESAPAARDRQSATRRMVMEKRLRERDLEN